MQQALSTVEPLPPTAVLDEAIQAQQALRANLQLSTEIELFRDQAASMGASRRYRLVAHLQSALQTRKQQLFKGDGAVLSA